MQTKDHLALGQYLLQQTADSGIHEHAAAFLLGCIEPDYNIPTYLRGIRGCQKFRGHNAENALPHIKKCLTRFQDQGIHSAWDFFTLGTLLHYAADSFTWPHNAFWTENLLAHRAYEKNLHQAFRSALHSAGAFDGVAPICSEKPFTFEHQQYCAAHHAMETDCQYIIGVCSAMFLGALCYCTPSTLNKIIPKEAACYESAYHHRLVQACH